MLSWAAVYSGATTTFISNPWPTDRRIRQEGINSIKRGSRIILGGTETIMESIRNEGAGAFFNVTFLRLH